MNSLGGDLIVLVKCEMSEAMKPDACTHLVATAFHMFAEDEAIQSSF